MADVRSMHFSRDEKLVLEDDTVRRRKLADEFLRDDTRELPMHLRNAIGDFLEELDAPRRPGLPEGISNWIEIGQFVENQERRNIAAAASISVWTQRPFERPKATTIRR